VSVLPAVLRSSSAGEVAARLRAERRGLPFLLFREPGEAQRIVELGEVPALTIGRQPSCDVCLGWDPEVSRVHAVLERVADEWTAVDDGLSRNGTRVNGERLHGRRRLRDGDALTVGGTVLGFFAAGRGDVRATDAARHGAAPELSPAQRRVLLALCAPLQAGPFAAPASNREVADALFLSVDTVKGHLQALFEAFGVGTVPQNRKRAELARRALESGAVPPG
jgi:pSer/pThr/pTyr-binding forkhead associated (FHA) protein